MGNSNQCTCLKRNQLEDKKFEYVVFSGTTGSSISDKKGLKVQYSIYELPTSDMDKQYNDCSFTRTTDNSKSISAFNADADQLSLIEQPSTMQ